MEEASRGRGHERAVRWLLVAFMVLQVADVVVTEVLLRSGQAFEANPWMRAEEARLYGKPAVGLGVCAAILLGLPPGTRRPAAMAAVGVALLPFVILGIQLLLRA